MKCITVVISFFILRIHLSESTNWKKIINEVNSLNGAWKAGFNFPQNISSGHIKQLMGTVIQKEKNIFTVSLFESVVHEIIPDEFDSRERWPECQIVMNHIRDQGSCGSCWAVAAASTFTDRLCVASKRGINNTIVNISADHILGCTFIGGCWGGFLRMAWWHIKHRGAVTGGDYNSKEGCKPYSMQPCLHHSLSEQREKCRYLSGRTPKCQSYCTNSDYSVHYQNDFYKVKDYFVISGERNIQREILSGGPVEAGFRVYEDFLLYKSGVYNHIIGKFVGGHAVKILGWGVEHGVPYWLCANSWNTDWGDSGFFKIRRGKNEGEIEDGVYGGIF